ncbi:MAG TPA: hypothetical protein VGW96_01680 [Candidatus Eremiobacteraceae bacterium]|jgi:hypothetical protein|nr:hypothetical protein [Candidatus Eremiobacteraceae bacterium]
MPAEQWNVIVSIATLVVLLTAALAALVQLRHIRASNELSTFSQALDLWSSPGVQQGLQFIQHDLATKMKDPAFRGELDTPGPVDHSRHPELNVLDYFDNVAIYLILGNMREDMIMQAAGQLVCSLWQTLSPTIAIMRRQRGPQMYVSFEYLVARAQIWHKRYPNGYLPTGFQRLPNTDMWLSADTTPPA